MLSRCEQLVVLPTRREWRRIFLDALREIGGLGAERFNHVQLGEPKCRRSDS